MVEWTDVVPYAIRPACLAPNVLSEQALARLSALNRATIAGSAAPSPPIHAVRDSAPEGDAAHDAAPRGPRVVFGGRPGETALAELAPGEEMENGAGRHYRIRTPLVEFWPRGADLIGRWSDQSEEVRGKLAEQTAPPDLSALAENLIQGAIYLDLETCGFAGSMVFLVGLLHREGDVLVLDQLLARDYAEEASMLAAVWPIVARNHSLATFNGKAFDWPMVHDRSTVHRLGRPEPYPNAPPAVDEAAHYAGDAIGPGEVRPRLHHCDLLHHARRLWRRRLPNCKLQTIERHLCRRLRGPDIPGAEIPDAYHRFVRTGDARQMALILSHNALDLATLLETAYRAICETAYLGGRR